MKIFRVIYDIFAKFIADGCSTYAAAMTYVSLLALVPFSIVFFTILSFVGTFQGYIQQIQNFIFSNFIASSADVIREYLLDFIGQGAQLSLLSVAALLVTVILVAMNVVDIFDKIWRVRKQRKVTHVVLKYALIIIFFPFVVGVLLFLSSFVYLIPHVEKLNFLFPPILIFIAFTVIYNQIPNCHIHWRSSLISGLISTLLFITIKNIFSIYISNFSNYNALYGLFSVIPVFLVWIYICWLIVIFGVEVNYVVEKTFFARR